MDGLCICILYLSICAYSSLSTCVSSSHPFLHFISTCVYKSLLNSAYPSTPMSTHPSTTSTRPFLCISSSLFLHLSFFLAPGFELRACMLSHSSSLSFFCEVFLRDRVSWTILPGWLQMAMILLISASWVARITGMSHWCLALFSIFIYSSISLYLSIYLSIHLSSVYLSVIYLCI
jgi:hypothetical protein